MKTTGILLISALSLFVHPRINAQDRKVQLRVIENGKVIKDTTFSVKEEIKNEDLSNVEKMLNKEDVLISRDSPFESFSYQYHGNHASDSAFRHEKRIYVDSAFVVRKFSPDSLNRQWNDMHFRQSPPFPRGRIIQREIIYDDNQSVNDDSKVIVNTDNKGKTQVIIRDEDGNMKTIRKKIDDDMEIIIIKKDNKKGKTSRNNKRE